jgi:hypothetical protein
MERCESKVQLGSHIHTFDNAGECEGMSPHTPKWTFTLGVPKFSYNNLKGQNSLDWGLFYTIRNFLRWKCLKWAHMIHLNTYNTSYGWKKGQESKCQIDSQPLKVRNRSKLHACKRCATYHWKALNEGYNFSWDLTSIRGLHKKLWVSKMVGVSILRIVRLSTWKSRKKFHLDVAFVPCHKKY